MNLPADAAVGDPRTAEIVELAQRLRLGERSAELDTTPAFPWPEFRALADAGLLGLRIPAEHGGQGLPLRRAGRLLYLLGKLGGTTFAKLALQPEFCSVLAEQGSDALRARYFRPLIRGERLVGNHVTEPAAGSDAGALDLRAVPDRDEYVLTGTKSEVAFAADAHAAIVYARVARPDAPGAGVTAFAVPQDLEGIRRTVIPDLGERWMRRGKVEYDHVRVPRESMIGNEGAAFGYLKDELTRERALLAAIYLGVARASWEETVRYVGERRAFGDPLSRQQAVGFPLVEDWARLDAAWRYVDGVLGSLDQGSEAAGPSALAKWLATDTALIALDHAIQFHGGRGYSKALPHEQRWRDVRSGAIGHGPSEIMHLVAARALWSRPSTEPRT